MSTVTVYKPHPDPWHAFREDDPLGDAMAAAVGAVLDREDRRGGGGALLRAIVRPAGHHRPDGRRLRRTRRAAGLAPPRDRRGRAGRTRWDPMPYSPIHDDDISAQLEPLLDAADVPATIVNWGGDEPVSVQEWSAYFGELLGVERGGRRRRGPRRVRRIGR